MNPSFILIGIDDNQKPSFSDEALECINNGCCFSGGARHHGIVCDILPSGYVWLDITVPLCNVFSRYEEWFSARSAPIVVFASGDPLFFGFANTIMREMPDADLRIIPCFNSLQMLAHRIPMRYDDMRVVSLTGRPWKEFDRALIERTPKIGILTDHKHTPSSIAARMLEYGYDNYVMYVGERLGNDMEEHVGCFSLEEATRREFISPNSLILRSDTHFPRRFGIPDEEFEHLDGRSRMITKMAIRLLTLQALELPKRSVMWDVGFCTGSISIEAKLCFPALDIVSFEIRPECERLMDINSHRFGAPGIETLMGDFLDADLSSLEAPDAVFIGGHGGRLIEIIGKLVDVMRPGGTIVFNSVSDESRAMFEDAAKEFSLKLHEDRRIALDDYNPITIMRCDL